MSRYYIFSQEAADIFYEKLEKLHESYVYHLIMSGAAPKGSDLESIKMTKNPQVKENYCKRIVGGLLNVEPNIILKLIEDKKTRLECVITKIDDNCTYMIQNVIDYPKPDYFSCQIWYLGETNTDQIRGVFN